MQAHGVARPLSEPFGDPARDTGTPVRQEVELAKVAKTQQATRVGEDIGFLVVARAVA